MIHERGCQDADGAVCTAYDSCSVWIEGDETVADDIRGEGVRVDKCCLVEQGVAVSGEAVQIRLVHEDILEVRYRVSEFEEDSSSFPKSHDGIATNTIYLILDLFQTSNRQTND